MTDQPDRPAAPRAAGHDTELPATVEVLAETARIDSLRRETGRVRVELVTDTEETTVPATSRIDRVEVTRHPVGRVVATAPEPRVEGDVTIIPVVEEQAVVTTRLVLTEEIHIRRIVETRDEELPVTLRRQRAQVSRLDEPDAT